MMRSTFQKLATSLIALAATAAIASEVSLDKNINGAHFSYRVPSSFQEIPIQGTDSEVTALQGDEFRLTTDYGLYSAPADFPYRLEIISGYPVEISFKRGDYDFQDGSPKFNFVTCMTRRN